MSFLACAVSAIGLLAAAQVAAEDALTAIELRNEEQTRALLERRALFLDAWQRSSPEARADSRTVLLGRGGGARRAAAIPTVRAFTDAWRILEQESSGAVASHSAAQLLVDSLDLRISPGAFAARDGGLPEALVVRVRPLYPLTVEHAFELSLYWISATGEELRARTESIAATALRGPGFDMFIRAPSNLPGSWKLVPRVVYQKGRATGVPVDFYGIEALQELRSLLADEDPFERRELDRLLEFGLRPVFKRALLHALGVLATSDRAGWRGPRRSKLELDAFAGVGELWHMGEMSSTPKEVFLLLPPGDEGPVDIFVGPAGDAWRELAEAREGWVLSSDLPIHSESGPNLFTAVDALKQRYPDCSVFVIARGAAVPELQVAFLRKSALDLDGLWLCTASRSGGRPAYRLPYAGGVITCEAAADDTKLVERDGLPSWEWHRDPAPLVIADLRLPGRIERWLDQVR